MVSNQLLRQLLIAGPAAGGDAAAAVEEKTIFRCNFERSWWSEISSCEAC